MHRQHDILDQTQAQLEDIADDAEHATGIDWREFMFMSLIAAAALAPSTRSLIVTSPLARSSPP